MGDCRQLFTIKSISKPFVCGLALEDHGLEHVLSKVGVEPTGEAFNAIVLDEASNRPFNPMVNAGAIATADLIQGKDFPERVTRLLAMFGKYCGREMYIDNSVFMSERLTGHRNRAIGLAGAFALSRWIEALLFGVTATDPATFAVVVGTLLAVATIACYIPAWRATRVDPTTALRAE